MNKRLVPYLFIAPYLALTVVFTIYPLLNAAVLAFYQTNGPASRTFVGIDNFRFLLGDPSFHRALTNTTVFTAASVVLVLPLAMGLAVLLHGRKGRARGFLRLLLFSPNLVGGIFVGILFAVLFTPRYGLMNRALHALFGWGLEERFLGNPALVMPAIVVTALWVSVGFNMIYFLAALQGVDKTLEEAARIDGANRLQVFRYVTLPSMRHVVGFVLVTTVISSFQLFELPLALLASTDGKGPDNSGLTLITYLYDVGFNTGDLGLGSAIGWIVAALIFGVSMIQLKLSGLAREQA